MAKVSLRIYNREIENLIEQGQINEAIAHCHHILKTFPKHLETYRLLGKAYLEGKRNADARDIFSRALMAVPDDFVSHVGMGIISDEENKIDDAIWHLERAFETQPSNPAIQAELQRLYGRRDGLEPPKIRMTRGALANMYVQGELYPQAVAEIRAVLSEDPERMDMQTLLARAFFRSGQKADASDMCAQLLKRYAYNFDANRIMVDLLTSAAGAESTQVYRMRVGELDPYAIFAKGSVFNSAEVPDAAVNLERLEYSEEEAAPSWGASLGMGAPAASERPDWLQAGYSDEPPASPAPPKEEIPDFLRAAGWGAATEPERPTLLFDEQTEAAAPANLPDWLRAQTPGESQPPQPSAPETPDWLGGLGAAADLAQPSASSISTGELPADLPDWLGGLGEPSSAPAAAASKAQPADLPDWLGGLGEPSSAPAAAASQAQPADLPDWLSGAAPQPASQPAPSVESLGASAAEQDDAVAWLESLAAKHGAKPEELVTDPSKRSETPPEWVTQAQQVGTQPTKPVTGALNIGEQFFAEFEQAASAEPAKEQPTEETLERGKIPEWLQETAEEEEAPQAQKIDWEATESSATDLNAWLSNLDQQPGLPFERTPTPDSIMADAAAREVSARREKSASETELPAWLSDFEEKRTHEEAQPFAEEDAAYSEPLPDWLQAEEPEPQAPAAEEEDAPPWEHREKFEASLPQPKPTQPSDWKPAAPKPEKASPSPKPAPQKPAPTKTEPKRKSPARSRQTNGVPASLEQAKAELARGDIPAALKIYASLIKRGKHLEEIIRDLTDSLYRYPVEVSIWQTLGDAYMRANRLQEALEAYNKAEELIR